MSARETAAEASLSTSKTSMVSHADMNVSFREKVTTHFGFPLVWTDGASGGGNESLCSSAPHSQRMQKLVSLLVTEASAQRSCRSWRAGGQESLVVEELLLVHGGGRRSEGVIGQAQDRGCVVHCVRVVHCISVPRGVRPLQFKD